MDEDKDKTPPRTEPEAEPSASEDKTRLISIPEAAELYGFTPQYLSRLAKKGRLKAQKIADRWITTPQDVEDFIRSRERRGVYRDDISLNG
jgi:hypothetical protein